MVSVMHVHAKIVKSVLTVWTKRSSMVLDGKNNVVLNVNVGI